MTACYFGDSLRLQRALGYPYRVRCRHFDSQHCDHYAFDVLEVSSPLWLEYPVSVLVTAHAGGRYVLESDIDGYLNHHEVCLAAGVRAEVDHGRFGCDPGLLSSAIMGDRFYCEATPTHISVSRCVVTGLDLPVLRMADFRRLADDVLRFRDEVASRLPHWVQACAA